jgi:excisionase family DNA binding protein
MRGATVAAEPAEARSHSMDHSNHNHYLRTAEVARILHVSPKTISRWAKQERLPYVKTLGGHRRFPAKAIKELANRLAEGE